MVLAECKELRDALVAFPGREEESIDAKLSTGPPAEYYKGSTYAIISTAAYLMGIPKNVFENEFEPPRLDIYEKLETDRSARIIRNLCVLRAIVERNFGKINLIMTTEHRGLSSIPELISTECLKQLAEDGIVIKGNQRLCQHIIDFNRQISDRINNCKDLFPIWINWSYIRDIFIMPNGLCEDGIRSAADEYYKYKTFYPYQIYMNWRPADEGNILHSDKKFVTLLYMWHNDRFKDYSKVSDASVQTKNNIYDFLEASGKTVFVVDCENSDPYKLHSTLKNLDEAYLRKITKIILYDDANASTAWRILDSFTDIAIEHILNERLKQTKSLVDISLTAGTVKEFYKNNVDSFVIVSSDSDYWALISSIPEANFLVMLEYSKTGADIKNALYNSGIFYCFIDDFYSGDNNEIKTVALLREVKRYLEEAVRVNVNDMMNAAYHATRIDLPLSEQKQFYNKYIKPMHFEIDDAGNLSIQLRAK